MTKKPYTIAGLVANGFQAEEFLEPKRACEAAGAHVDVISLQPGEMEAFNYFQRVGTLTVDKTIEQVHPEDYDAVLIPGGAYSPATLGGDDRVLAFLRQLHQAHKPIAAICRGALLLGMAQIVRGRRVTGFHSDTELTELSVKPGLEQAGAVWVARAVVVDHNLISSQHPRHLPAFNDAVLKACGLIAR